MEFIMSDPITPMLYSEQIANKCRRCGMDLPIDRFSMRRAYCKECARITISERAKQNYLEKRDEHVAVFAQAMRRDRHLQAACESATLLRQERFNDLAHQSARLIRWMRLFDPLVQRTYEIRKERSEKQAVEIAKAIRQKEHLGRPRRRADCLEGGFNCERPCPYVTCREHLFCNVDPESGTIKFAWPDKNPEDLEHTCALDIADEGAHVLEEIASRVNMVRERVRQLEIKGLAGLHILMCKNWERIPCNGKKIPCWYFQTREEEQDEVEAELEAECLQGSLNLVVVA